MAKFIQCLLCSKLNNSKNLECESCGKVIEANKVNEQGFPLWNMFKSGWYEHIDRDPIYIGSRKQLKDETVSRDKFSHYIQ